MNSFARNGDQDWQFFRSFYSLAQAIRAQAATFLIANLALAPYAAKARVMQDMHRPGCTGQPDSDFLAMLIPHHEGAVDMARLVLIHGRDAMVRKIAEEIVASQTVEIAVMRGRMAASGFILQTQVPNHPHSRRRSITRLALLMFEAILPAWCTMPASASERFTSALSKLTICSASKLANARRKFSRLLRMVSQLKPACKPSRQIFFK